jgi:predicted kinase
MYLNDHYDLPEYPLYDDTWGPVILLSGLPGTGKDTFAASHYPDLPMISLDEIRRELGVLPEESQMRVVDTANERAKAYLRRKEPFLWNATNLSPRIRQRIIGMMTDYKASVRIEFLETSWEEGLRRNAQRSRQVPEQAIGRMLQELVPPQPWEAGEVRWHCI